MLHLSHWFLYLLDLIDPNRGTATVRNRDEGDGKFSQIYFGRLVRPFKPGINTILISHL